MKIGPAVRPLASIEKNKIGNKTVKKSQSAFYIAPIWESSHCIDSNPKFAYWADSPTYSAVQNFKMKYLGVMILQAIRISNVLIDFCMGLTTVYTALPVRMR